MSDDFVLASRENIAANKDFIAYKENLEKFEFYTFLTPEERELYEKESAPIKNMSLSLAKKSPYLWAKYALGVIPDDYQWKMLHYMKNYKQVAMVTSRQIGKSRDIAWFSHYVARNSILKGIIPHNGDRTPPKVKVVIVSMTEPSAKKLLKDVMDVIQDADNYYADRTRGTKAYQKHKFTSEISKSTMFTIEFHNGSSIEIFPPTGRIRGNSIDYLIIDEADWLYHEDPDYFFSSEAMPTLTATDGNVILASTPRGTKTFFKDIIRPEEDRPAGGWKRLWFPWTVCERIHANIWNKRENEYLAKGKGLDFKIEYEASFQSGKYTYFNPEDINNAILKGKSETWDSHIPVTVGLDFGDTHSRTVITVVMKNNETDKIELLWYKEFEAGYNNSLLPKYIRGLASRFNIRDIVVDDCVGGKTAIELLRQDNWNIKLFGFKALKQEYYEYTKVAFANKRIELYDSPELIAQLKSIEAHMTPMGNLQIKKAKGMNDDICDSLVMSLSPYIQPKKHGKRYVL